MLRAVGTNIGYWCVLLTSRWKSTYAESRVMDTFSSFGGGTSASAPIVAALFNRIVEERLRAGKKSLGFLNPSIYQHPELFTDITSGNSPGCGTNGFQAV